MTHFPTVVVDGTGEVHAAYSVGQPGVLFYARGRAGSWHVVETPESGGFYPQIAIDSSAVLHLVHGGYPGGLRYLRKGLQDDEFEYELVASPLAFDIGFALDASDEPVACFFDGDSGGAPKCFEHSTGAWEALDPPRPETTGGISIAIDSSNTLHFVADGVIYFSRQGGEWSAEEEVSTVGSYPPVAVGDDGVPHVAYAEERGDIRHAYRAGADNWIRDTVEHTVQGKAPTLFIDRNDVLHVAYVDVTNSNLKYARLDGDTWSTETVDPSATIPDTPKLFVDESGTPHIVYVDTNDADLRYAYLCP